MPELRDGDDRSRISTMADRSRCPNCGERVSPYAAGCAICGADLDARRWDAGPGAGQRAGSWLSALTFGSETGKWLLILAVVLVLGMPLLAMLGIY
jgi:hypothetical protein